MGIRRSKVLSQCERYGKEAEVVEVKPKGISYAIPANPEFLAQRSRKDGLEQVLTQGLILCSELTESPLTEYLSTRRTGSIVVKNVLV